MSLFTKYAAIVWVSVLALCGHAYAADSTVSNLTAATTPLDGTELLYCVQGSADKKCATSTLGSAPFTANGNSATASTSSADRVGQVVNAKADFGAKGDAQSYSDGTATAGGTTLTSASRPCTIADAGKYIILHGSGTSFNVQMGQLSLTTPCTGSAFNLPFTAVNATPWFGSWAATVSAAGTGNLVGDVLTAAGGTGVITEPSYTVATLSGSGVATVTSAAGGQFASIPSPNTVTTNGVGTGVTLTPTLYQIGGYFTIGTDDTAAVMAAVAAAKAAKLPLRLSSGAYWLASQTSAIDIGGVQIIGDGWPSRAFPFSGGTTLLISNPTTAAFTNVTDTTMRDMALYYPGIDNGPSTPVAYPETFGGTLFINDDFDNLRVMNSYDLFKVANAGGSAVGRVRFSKMLAYCVDKCFWYLNGQADQVAFDATNQWNIGAYSTFGTGGPGYLDKYTQGSGEWMRVDTGAGGYANVDGVTMNGGSVHGYRFGLRVLSGLFDVSKFNGVAWDGVGSVASAEGTGRITSTNFTGGDIYSTNTWDATQAASVWAFSASNSTQSNIQISGVYVQYSQGGVVTDTTGSLSALTMNGVRVDTFGQTTSAGTFGFVNEAAGNGTAFSITSNDVTCGPSHTQILLHIGGFVNGQAKSNKAKGCGIGFEDARSGGANPFHLTDNMTLNSVFGSLHVTGASNNLYEYNNHWDVTTATYAKPTLTSGWGAGAALATVASDNFARITIGTGPSSPAVLTFNFQKPVAPICAAIDETSSVALVAVATVTTVTVTGATSVSDVVAISCRPAP